MIKGMRKKGFFVLQSVVSCLDGKKEKKKQKIYLDCLKLYWYIMHLGLYMFSWTAVILVLLHTVSLMHPWIFTQVKTAKYKRVCMCVCVCVCNSLGASHVNQPPAAQLPFTLLFICCC